MPPAHRLILLTGGLALALLGTACDTKPAESLLGPAEGSTIEFRRARGVDGTISALLEAPDGSGAILLGGEFEAYDQTESAGLVRVGAAGEVDLSLSVGEGFDDRVAALAWAEDGSGALYVGGEFRSYRGVTTNRIARLDAAGTLDTSFAIGTGFNFPVTDIAPAGDGSGDIYVAGEFSTYDGATAGSLVRLNSDGSLDTGFDTGGGFDNDVLTIAVAVDGSGDVYAGGDFSQYKGGSASRLVRLHSDGSREGSFAGGNSPDGDVLAALPATDGSGAVFIGGRFRYLGASYSPGVARVAADGSLDSSFDVGNGFDFKVSALAHAADGSGDLYTGGSFADFDGTAVANLVRLNSDGSLDTGFDVGDGPEDEVFAVLPLTDGTGRVVLGGRFVAYAGSGANGVARVAADGAYDTGFAHGAGADDVVEAIVPAPEDEGTVYLAGQFRYYDGVAVRGLLRVRPDGSRDEGFAVGAGFDDDVFDAILADDGSGDIYAGGRFDEFDGTAGLGRIARVRADGSLDATFAAGSAGGANERVHALAAAGDGSGGAYLGGDFTSYGGTARSRFARVNGDGTLDTSLAVGTGFNNRVEAISPAEDGSGDVYVGGRFTAYDGAAVGRIVRLNSDGTLDTGFAAGAGFDNVVEAIVPVGDGSGDLYVGGRFTSYDGAAVFRLVRLNTDGSVDAALATGTGFDNTVDDVVPTPEGGVFVVGRFQSYDGTAHPRIALLDATGAADPAFAAGAGFDATVRTAARAGSAGALYVGGTFDDYDRIVVDHVVLLASNGTSL